MTREQRARRYLQASMSASYTDQAPEAKAAAESLMRSHERAYPRVREHALAGADNDFDERLTAGEREHQRHLRRTEGLQEADVQRIRSELRKPAAAPPRKPASSRRSGGSAGPRAARSAATAGAEAITAAATGGGSTVTYLFGVALLLCLVYLLIAGKGVNAVTGITNLVVGAAGTFIKPVDPVAAAQRAFGGTTTPSQAGAGRQPAGNVSPSALVPHHSAGAGSGPAKTPAAAGALTWDSLRRQIKEHKLTPAQVNADLRTLQGH